MMNTLSTFTPAPQSQTSIMIFFAVQYLWKLFRKRKNVLTYMLSTSTISVTSARNISLILTHFNFTADHKTQFSINAVPHMTRIFNSFITRRPDKFSIKTNSEDNVLHKCASRQCFSEGCQILKLPGRVPSILVYHCISIDKNQ